MPVPCRPQVENLGSLVIVPFADFLMVDSAPSRSRRKKHRCASGEAARGASLVAADTTSTVVLFSEVGVARV